MYIVLIFELKEIKVVGKKFAVKEKKIYNKYILKKAWVRTDGGAIKNQEGT